MDRTINMWEGLAKGGPRDGVRLTAGSSWDGRVKDSAFRQKQRDGRPKTRFPESEPGYYHPGHYMYNPYSFIWEWFPNTELARKEQASTLRTWR